MNPATSSI